MIPCNTNKQWLPMVSWVVPDFGQYWTDSSATNPCRLGNPNELRPLEAHPAGRIPRAFPLCVPRSSARRLVPPEHPQNPSTSRNCCSLSRRSHSNKAPPRSSRLKHICLENSQTPSAHFIHLCCLQLETARANAGCFFFPFPPPPPPLPSHRPPQAFLDFGWLLLGAQTEADQPQCPRGNPGHRRQLRRCECKCPTHLGEIPPENDIAACSQPKALKEPQET